MESTATRPEEISRQESTGSAFLWFGLLGAPLAWAAQLVANYAVEEWLACAPGSRTPGRLLGAGIERWVLGITIVTCAIAVTALLVSWLCYRRLRTSDAVTGDRARWMARAGLVNSLIFLFPLALGFASPVLLDPCRSAS